MRALVEKCSEGNYSRGDWEVNTTPRNESKPPRDRLLERNTPSSLHRLRTSAWPAEGHAGQKPI